MAPEGFKTPPRQISQTVNVAEGQTVEVDFKLARGPKMPVVTVPIIIMVLIFQRRIVAGLTAGAVKG